LGNRGTLPIFIVPERVKRHVRVAVYDMLGRLVRTVRDEESPAGTGRAVWDREEERGRRVSAGIYFCELQAGGKAERRKLILVR
jgi:flagellar hook assembly protein FlgD